MRTCIILGTRPEIVKFSPIIRELQRRGSDFQIVHTGQHYSFEMDRVFFEDLELPTPDINLEVGSGRHGVQTGRMLEMIEAHLLSSRPDVVLVQGDTNTVLAGALAAAKLVIPIGHVEAGLRSYDRRMPEETNRVLADRLSDMLFAPTQRSKGNLVKEGIPAQRIFVTGNTVVDAVRENLDIATRKVDALGSLSLKEGEFILVTLHRQENVDSKERLGNIFNGLARVAEETGLRMIFPVHPRTEKNIRSFGINVPKAIETISPLGFLEFLQLEGNAALAMTDSGGVQEEACILGVPCVTLRENTERPETVDVGANVVVGSDPLAIIDGARRMLSRRNDWTCPLGAGDSGKRIVDICHEMLDV